MILTKAFKLFARVSNGKQNTKCLSLVEKEKLDLLGTSPLLAILLLIGNFDFSSVMGLTVIFYV